MWVWETVEQTLQILRNAKRPQTSPSRTTAPIPDYCNTLIHTGLDGVFERGRDTDWTTNMSSLLLHTHPDMIKLQPFVRRHSVQHRWFIYCELWLSRIFVNTLITLPNLCSICLFIQKCSVLKSFQIYTFIFIIFSFYFHLFIVMNAM